MSLRAKALVAVLALVGIVTGGLGAYVGKLYEDAERRRIESDLRKDARRLRGILESAHRVTESALKDLPRDVPRLLQEKDIKEGFDYHAATWKRQTGSDVAVAAIDAFVAGERGARVLHRTENLAICGFAGEKRMKELFERPEFGRLLEEVYRENSARLAVLVFSGRVYYAAALPIPESVQDPVQVGVAAVLVELSDGWVRAHRPEEQGNPIDEVIFAGRAVSGTTLSREAAARLLDVEGSPVFEVRLGADRYIGFREPFEPGSAAGLIAAKNLDRELGPLRALWANTLVGGAVLAFFGSFAAYGIAWILIRRIDRLRAATVRVRGGDFEVRLEPEGRDELAVLGHAFNDMVQGLKALGLYTDPELARRALESRDFLESTGRRAEGSVFFSDVKGFTSIAERLSPDGLIEQLNEFFTIMGERVKGEGGYLDKFIGDNVMAYWGPPFLRDGASAARSCRAALGCLEASRDLDARWASEGKPAFAPRIGIATGEVIVGNIGSRTKKNFTVIGDRVNLASRLEGTNKFYGTRLLVDGATRNKAGEGFIFREVDRIFVVGKEQPVEVYELVAMGAFDEKRSLALRLYAEALGRYRERDFKGALDRLRAIEPEDGPAEWLSRRCTALLESPPGPDWEPSTRATEK